jgi:hypothetical protein
MSHDHRVALHGPQAADDRISGHLFRDLLDVLIEGSERALRFRIEGRSAPAGPRPAWLGRIADFSLLRVPELGASTAAIESKPLIETMPERFKQNELFDNLDPSKSPIELFEDGLEDAINGNGDSVLFDPALVKTFERFASLLDQGLDDIELINGRTLRIDRSAVERVSQLQRASPQPQRARVAGRLEAIRYSDCRFSLVLRDGETVQGTAVGPGQGALQSFFGKQVVVSGMAIFRPSGKPLRLDAESFSLATEQEEKIWSSLPKPLLGLRPPSAWREEQRPKGDLKALLGKWPGDEEDDEVQSALETLS